MRSNFSIQSACMVLGYTRQAYYKQHALPQDNVSVFSESMLQSVRKARKEKPTKGCRAIYERDGHKWPLGRDRSIDLLMRLGYRVKFPKRYRKATQAGKREFSNLLVNRQVTGINQVWQSDMAYYLHGNAIFYTIYITDVYSQEVVGHGAFKSNFATNYAIVLRSAIRCQKNYTNGLEQLIHHSDGGKQYESNVYKKVCQKHGITQSMCIYSYENPYAEKTNDLINNGYLNIWKPKTLAELRKRQKAAVNDHNKNSRKKRLGKLNPLAFKTKWLNNPNDGTLYTLQLKPTQPEQPKNKTVSLTNN